MAPREEMTRMGVSPSVIALYNRMSLAHQLKFFTFLKNRMKEAGASISGVVPRFFHEHPDLAEQYEYQMGMAIGGKVMDHWHRRIMKHRK